MSRLAVGSPLPAPATHVLLPPDLTQEDHAAGLPLGTRGGTSVQCMFPLDGTYEFQIRLSRDRNENVEGLHEPHHPELTLDGRRLELFTVVPNRYKVGDYYSDEAVDRDLKCAPRCPRARTKSARRFRGNRLRCSRRCGSRIRRTSTWTGIRACSRRPFGFDYRTLRHPRRRRHAEPPPHLRLPSRERGG